ILRMNRDIDVREIVPSVRVPTLILHRVGDSRITVDAGRYLADNIPGAKFIELPGTSHTPWAERDISDRIVDEIQEFLTGSRGALRRLDIRVDAAARYRGAQRPAYRRNRGEARRRRRDRRAHRRARRG